jgi:hypothetical protein
MAMAAHTESDGGIRAPNIIEAILPISTREPLGRHSERAELLIRSMVFFWNDPRPLKLHIVCPRSEITGLKIELSRVILLGKLELIYHSDEEVLGELHHGDRDIGYAKQMLIKLAAGRLMTSAFYLVLDSDVACCRSINHDAFFIDDKAISDWAVPTLYAWWEESAKVLGYEFSPSALRASRLGITPQILNKTIVTRLTDYLGGIFGEPWIQGLINRYSGNHPFIWTEYTMYDLFAEKEGLRGLYHVDPVSIPRASRLHHKEMCLWSEDNFLHWSPEEAFSEPAGGFFFVMQSILCRDLDYDIVRDRFLHGIKSRFAGRPF